MDRLTEFVSKSFTVPKQGDGSENNNVKSPFSSIDMSKATLDKEAHLLGKYGDTDIDIDVLSEKDGSNSIPSPTPPAVVSDTNNCVSSPGLISTNTTSSAALPPHTVSSSSALTPPLSTSLTLSSLTTSQQSGGIGMALPNILHSSSAVAGGHRTPTVGNISSFSIDSLSARVVGDKSTSAPPPSCASTAVFSSTVTSTTPAPSAARTLTASTSSHSLHAGNSFISTPSTYDLLQYFSTSKVMVKQSIKKRQLKLFSFPQN